MTPWLLLGAGGNGVGALVAALGLAEGRNVVVLVRDARAAAGLRHAGAAVVEGDACDADLVATSCRLAGQGATVISTLGGAQDYLAHRTVIDGAERSGLTRLVLVTALGCGESWVDLSARTKTAFGPAVREKSLAESWLQTSTLDFAILRPGGLLDGEATGNAVRSQAAGLHGFVMRSDVAAHVAELANMPRLNRQVYGLVDPGLKPV